MAKKERTRRALQGVADKGATLAKAAADRVPSAEGAADAARRAATGAADKTKGLAKSATDHLPKRDSESGEEEYVRPGVFTEPDEVADRAAAEHFEAEDLSPDVGTGTVALDADSLLLAGLVICDEIAELTAAGNENRSRRMDNVVRRRYGEMAERVPTGDFNPDEVLRCMTESWDRAAVSVALIELETADPFSPFELRYRASAHKVGMRRVASLIGASDDEVGAVEDTLRDARRAHKTASFARIGLVGLGGAVVFGAAGFLAAPALGAALGSAAGMSGAAAGSFGLALLGGGSLAAGGLGMTGGLWMVTGVAAATGLVGTTGGAMLNSLGSDQLRSEVVKLQATYKLVLLRSQAELATAQSVVENLHVDAEFLRQTVAEERELNDANSHRVAELEAKIETIEAAIEWMEGLEPAS